MGVPEREEREKDNLPNERRYLQIICPLMG